MSLASNGSTIHCDSENCNATTYVPVALSAQSNSAHPPLRTADGWLFIVRGNHTLHYCTRCAPQKIVMISESHALAAHDEVNRDTAHDH